MVRIFVKIIHTVAGHTDDLEPSLCCSPPISAFGLIAPLSLKIAPKGVIPPTLRTTYLKCLMTKRLRKIIKKCLPENIYNNYTL